MPRDEARAWLRKAEQDLAAAEVLVVSDEPVAEVAAFHCQQAAEKAVKAIILRHDKPVERTHDLLYLHEILADLEPDADRIEEALGHLDPYAVEVRYPSEELELTQEETETALRHAETVVGFARSRID